MLILRGEPSLKAGIGLSQGQEFHVERGGDGERRNSSQRHDTEVIKENAELYKWSVVTEA